MKSKEELTIAFEIASVASKLIDTTYDASDNDEVRCMGTGLALVAMCSTRGMNAEQIFEMIALIFDQANRGAFPNMTEQ